MSDEHETEIEAKLRASLELLNMLNPEVRMGEGPDKWASERADVLGRFAAELEKATGDGSKKRQTGAKPPWYRDGGHEGAIFSHLTKWKRGEKLDPDSGAHPLVHAAWRCLAIALIETGNVPAEPYTLPGGEPGA